MFNQLKKLAAGQHGQRPSAQSDSPVETTVETAQSTQPAEQPPQAEAGQRRLRTHGLHDDHPQRMLTGLISRAAGLWPLTGQPPLTIKQFKQLFATRPAFVDYLPFVDYLADERVFLFNDDISCGAVFELYPPDMDARTLPEIGGFCGRLANALRSLPLDHDEPFIAQVYAEDREPQNIADKLYQAALASQRDQPYAQAWFAAQREHFQMMANPDGIYADDRTDGAKGWRAIDRRIVLVLYRKADKKIWDKDKRLSSFEQFNRRIEPAIQALKNIGFGIERMDDQAFYAWASPWLNPTPTGCTSTAVEWVARNPLPRQRGAAWDLAQVICPEPPQPIDPHDAERGILKLGEQYQRFISLQPIYQAPLPGAISTDQAEGQQILASLFDRLPAETIFVCTLIPQAKYVIQNRLERVRATTRKTKSQEADHAADQVDTALAYLMDGQDAVWYFQAGVYLRAASIDQLDDKTHVAMSLLDNSQIMRPIKEEYDLLATDSFIRNLPMVYDFRHDRRHALRAGMTYTSHIAAILPFYGRARGSKNPCFINYNRSGEIIQVNPFIKADRSRVAHSILLGPTGAGKSASQVGQAMQSMAINHPRQFFIDKGGSFAPLGDYYQKRGLKVRRITFDPSNDEVCFPPYAETAKALMQIRGEITHSHSAEDDDDDRNERRDYLSEMQYATELMITGGRAEEVQKMSQGARARLETALIAALIASEQAGHAHAIPADVEYQLRQQAAAEADVGGQNHIALELREMSDALSRWSKGARGHFFNRYGTGFDDRDDVIILEMGVLTNQGSEDMLAVAIMNMMTAITALGEKHQYSGRHTEVYFDEVHYMLVYELLVTSLVVAFKVWRKLNLWLALSTQNIDDFPEYASKILALLEWWWLLPMGQTEINKLNTLHGLSDETQALIKQAKKRAPYYVEGIMLSEKFEPQLIRMVPPAICLALAMTDGDEKKVVRDTMRKHQCSLLAATEMIAQNIVENRKSFSPAYR